MLHKVFEHCFYRFGEHSAFFIAEDDDVIFTIISLDGKSWDFESTTPDVRSFTFYRRLFQRVLYACITGIHQKHFQLILLCIFCSLF